MSLGLVEERAEQRGPPVTEVAVLLEPVLEQRFDSLQSTSFVKVTDRAWRMRRPRGMQRLEQTSTTLVSSWFRADMGMT
jgi:hypothetical protein